MADEFGGFKTLAALIADNEAKANANKELTTKVEELMAAVNNVDALTTRIKELEGKKNAVEISRDAREKLEAFENENDPDELMGKERLAFQRKHMALIKAAEKEEEQERAQHEKLREEAIAKKVVTQLSDENWDIVERKYERDHDGKKMPAKVKEEIRDYCIKNKAFPAEAYSEMRLDEYTKSRDADPEKKKADEAKAKAEKDKQARKDRVHDTSDDDGGEKESGGGYAGRKERGVLKNELLTNPELNAIYAEIKKE